MTIAYGHYFFFCFLNYALVYGLETLYWLALVFIVILVNHRGFVFGKSSCDILLVISLCSSQGGVFVGAAALSLIANRLVTSKWIVNCLLLLLLK